jgi:hypothetical protein
LATGASPIRPTPEIKLGRLYQRLVERRTGTCYDFGRHQAAGIRNRTNVTGTSPSLEDALALHDLGLAPVPAPADDGKSVEGAVAHHNRCRRRLPRSAIEDLFRRHPGADVAVLPHLCRPRLVVVAVDDPAALAAAEQRRGPTPLVVQTLRETGPPPLPGACPGTRSKVGGGKPCWA